MPLGIVSDEDFNKELENSGPPSVPISIPVSNKDMEYDESKGTDSELGPVVTSDAIIKRMGSGRHLSDVNVPQSMRKLIGDTAAFEGRPAALELAHSLGISNSSVAAYTNPSSSANNLSDSNKLDLLGFLSNRKIKISKRAIGKLNLALSLIDEEKLKDLGAVALSNVAKNMAEVSKKMEPEVKEEKKEPVQFHFYAPQVKNETHYEVVQAKDNY